MSIFDNLTPIDKSHPDYPHFFDETPVPPTPPQEPYYKIYHDGSHYMATVCVPHKEGFCKYHKKKSRTALDEMFDSLFFEALKEGFSTGKRYRHALKNYIRAGIEPLFGVIEDADEWLDKKIKAKAHGLGKRKKLCKRKANLNQWTHFVTLTYNDILHTEDTFRQKLRKTLSNLASRRGWRYMGVFERAPKTGRLHFHAIMYIPCGEMIGKLTAKKDFSERLNRQQITHENSFFKTNYGRNDFEELDKVEMINDRTVEYLLKYISKTNERIVYSRGIPAEIVKRLDSEDLALEVLDFVTKYVLFDDVISWEKDIMHFKATQGTLWDLMCNPSN